ncbi:MAG TPA: VCBS repeat-containing protein [Anaeromyxobacteraceae bacterium]|jgi:hypothetical protein
MYEMPWSGARQYGGLSLRLADVDGDGRLDAVVAALGSDGALVIHEGVGDGTFRPPYVVPVGLNVFAAPFVVSDVDLDGRLDFAFASWESVESAPAVLRGTPAGGLALAYSGPWTYTSIAVEDLDGNGWPDPALTRWQHPYGLDVLLGRGE